MGGGVVDFLKATRGARTKLGEHCPFLLRLPLSAMAANDVEIFMCVILGKLFALPYRLFSCSAALGLGVLILLLR
jgi:hypothetical protein